MTPTELVVDKAAEVHAEAVAWPDRARALKVTDALTYAGAAEALQAIKALRKKIADTFDPHIKRAHEAHAALCKDKRENETPLVEAEALIKRSLTDYDMEQQRRAEAERRRLEAEERQRIEQQRIEEAAALEKEAKATGDDDLLQTAMDIVNEPIVAPPVFVPKATPKVAGIVHRDNWQAHVTSLIDLVKFIAANPQHTNLVIANQTALNAMAKAMKKNLAIPGVAAVNNRGVAAR